MYKKAKAMAEWALCKAQDHGYDKLASQDWDDLKDCLTAAQKAVEIDKDMRVIESMERKENDTEYWIMKELKGMTVEQRMKYKETLTHIVQNIN